ncbi:MAG: sulfotransferase [Myxococcales bacterium FL481]|nr:MAG: sulfotransferase [Myxococcales bacterium FL481]
MPAKDPGAVIEPTSSVLERMNAQLATVDDEYTRHFTSPTRPVSFVVATPRSASTLFQQLVCSTLSVGCVSNIMARFWMAPFIGATLEQDLHDPRFVSALRSYGRHYNPANAHEPHEWGWFWRRWLKLDGTSCYCASDQELDARGLSQKLSAIESIRDAPLLFDNLYAMCNLDRLAAMLPRVLAIHLRRPPYYVANSILNARIDRYGDINAFFGHRPRNYDELVKIDDPVEQVVAQVQAIRREMDETLARFADDDVLTVDYIDLIQSPQRIMHRFADFLASHGAPVERRDPMPEFPQLRDRNSSAFVRSEHADRLAAHVTAYFGPDAVPSHKPAAGLFLAG